MVSGLNNVVIFAGGIGSRMGSSLPKQFLKVDSKPIIIHTIEKFSKHKSIDNIIVVCKEEYIELCRKMINKFNINKVCAVIAGGATGQQSIYNGLNYLVNNICVKDEDIVLIHDGVRPVIGEGLISKSIECVKKNGSSIAVSKAIETVIKISIDGKIVETIDRSLCRNAKAPQCFYLKDIWRVHQLALRDGKKDSIDSATLMSSYGYTLHTTECASENIKITTPNDYYMFKALYVAKKEGKYYE